jgi:hypothetical protein
MAHLAREAYAPCYATTGYTAVEERVHVLADDATRQATGTGPERTLIRFGRGVVPGEGKHHLASYCDLDSIERIVT